MGRTKLTWDFYVGVFGVPLVLATALSLKYFGVF